jgi:hypothetical protein
MAGRPIGLYAVTTDDRLAHLIPDQAVSSGLTGSDSDLLLPYRVWLRSC